MANVGRSIENGRGCKNFSKAVDEDEIHETELRGFSDARSLANGLISIYVLFENLVLLKLI